MTDKHLMEKLEGSLKKIEAEQAELLFTQANSALTRFCKNQIHQNMQVKKAQLQVRVVDGGRIGTYTTDRLEDQGIDHAITQALEIARNQKRDHEFVSLPTASPIVDTKGYKDETAAATPAKRAGMVKKIARNNARHQAEVAGSLSTEEEEIAVVNSLGVRAYQRSTVCTLNLISTKNGLTGYAYWMGHDIADLPYLELAGEALEKACFKGTKIEVPPGRYTVIIEPYAVGTMLADLSYVGFGAKAYQEGRSFMSTKLGKKVASPKITIWDEGGNPRGIRRVFDFEGVKKQKVTLIENGVARAVVYDSRTANKEKRKKNTGHALPAPNMFGPMAVNLFMRPGNKDLKRLVTETDYGIYVTRFHYVNVVEPISTIITGMTRDGTFLIEKGKLTKPVKDLRFTQSILEALSSVEAVSRPSRLVEAWFFGSCVPGLKIRNFQFTGLAGI